MMSVMTVTLSMWWWTVGGDSVLHDADRTAFAAASVRPW